MTKKELREHCERQVEGCEKWAKYKGIEPSGKIYEEHKLILELIKALEQQPSEDCVSRQAVLDNAYAYGNGLEPEGYCVNVEDIQALPPVTPIHGTCKDCRHCREDFSFTDKPKCLTHGLITVNDDFYCKDFEKRGNENG